ncbi:MAG: glycosyltransferase family 2 protein [Microthrixaceae bacterium]|nr:glycosyltransferase family 2 protein [Microthrixaceae bacterium]NLA35176.1 glycosyltransferase family 2 protein [Actinomycetota bacterium]
MPTVIIAAHNEQAVIRECVTALRQQRDAPELEIIVSANGCTDRTAVIAAESGAIVIDRVEAGKAAALNAGDELASRYPRIYLDADIVVPPNAISTLLAELTDESTALVAVPSRRVNTAGRPWPVRAYFSISERLPAFRTGLFGRGMIVVSARGRARFDTFPELIADDLFLDSQFSPAEKAEITGVEVVVESPYTTRALLRRLVRVRRGNAEMRNALGVATRPSDRWAWLRDVVRPNPRLIGAAIPYVLITLTADLLARRSPASGQEWGQDQSTRSTS